MNTSFIALGLAELIGAIILYAKTPKKRYETLGFAALAAAGIGTIGVGIFPENVNMFAHGASAALPFLVGNIGLILIGLGKWLPRTMRYYTIAIGISTLWALGLFVLQIDFGLGQGTIERIAAYPQTVWLIFMGFYLLVQNLKPVLYNQNHNG